MTRLPDPSATPRRGLALILGPRGRFGRHCARAFAAAGWQLRSLDRPGRAPVPGAAEPLSSDPLSASALAKAAQGAQVIVNGLNAPCPAWKSFLPPATRALIAAARASGAAVLHPANVYPFGADMPARLDETTPRAPASRKGRLRLTQQQTLAAAARDGVQVIQLRAGDFLDDAIAGNWFDSHISARVGRGAAVYPGALDRAHAWAFLPDVARAAEALAARRAGLAPGAGDPGDALSVGGPPPHPAASTAPRCATFCPTWSRPRPRRSSPRPWRLGWRGGRGRGPPEAGRRTGRPPCAAS